MTKDNGVEFIRSLLDLEALLNLYQSVWLRLISNPTLELSKISFWIVQSVANCLLLLKQFES